MVNKSSQSFSWEVLDQLPLDPIAIQFPRNRKDYSKDYVVHVMTISGIEWVGNFHGLDDNYFSGVFIWPREHFLCVISRGVAYVVNAEDPNIFDDLPIVPITDARFIDNMEIFIFSTYTHIYAWGQNGALWSTDRLAIDGIKIKSIESGILYGYSNNIDRTTPFTINIRTGEVSIY